MISCYLKRVYVSLCFFSFLQKMLLSHAMQCGYKLGKCNLYEKLNNMHREADKKGKVITLLSCTNLTKRYPSHRSFQTEVCAKQVQFWYTKLIRITVMRKANFNSNSAKIKKEILAKWFKPCNGF